MRDESSAFDLLYSKIFKEREIRNSNYIQALINSEREAARFIFCCYASSYYEDIEMDYKLKDNKPQKLLLSDIKYNLKEDVIWRSIWGNKKLKLEALGKWASDIIKRSLKQPLFHLILNKWSLYKSQYAQSGDETAYKHSYEYHKAYLILLRSSIDFEGTSVNILSCTSALSDYITKRIKVLIRKTEFVSKDIMNTYGRLASITSARENWRFNTIDIQNSCADKVLKENIASLVSGNESLIVKEDGKKDLFKFSIKPYRIFFKALHDADDFNYRERASYPVLFDRIYELSKISFVNSDLVNLDESFVEDVIVYSSILVKYLEEKRRNGFIDFLVQKSKSFRVSDRPDQILAIYILTVILSECSDVLNSEQRKLIFDNTYAKVAYKLQTMQFDNLIESSPFYLNEIIRTFNSNFQSRDFTTSFQPLYFFWYDVAFSVQNTDDKFQSRKVKSFCKSAFELRKQNWSGDYLISGIETISRLIDTGTALIKNYNINKNPPETRMLAYAISALLYSIANTINYNDIYREKLERLLVSKAAESSDLFELALFSDYIVRKSNKVYMKLDEKGISEKYYLLCGAFRLFCALGHHPCEHKLVLSKEMRSFYNDILKKESGRYFFLISYMLSFTDFFDNKIRSLEDIIAYERDTEFLLYDRLSMDNIQKYTLEIEKWRA